MTSQCINTNGFNFSKAKIEVFHNYKKKVYKSCKCNKCTKLIKNKSMCVIHLCQKNFLSSSLSVATSVQDAWDQFKQYIPNYIYGHFYISVTMNNILQCLFAQLFRVKFSKCCQKISLYFRYNFIPNPNCTLETDFLVYGNVPSVKAVSNNTIDPNNPYPNTCIQTNTCGKLCNTTYFNLKFYCDIDYVYTPNFSNLPEYTASYTC